MMKNFVRQPLVSDLRLAPPAIRNPKSATRKSGFTLVELLVVLIIAALMAAIMVGGFNEMRAGHKRTSCQTNLVQIYQALRLYADDTGGAFPFYDPVPPNTMPSEQANIGLWHVYTFPSASDVNQIAPADTMPIERYLRSPKVLHCPNHNANTNLFSDEAKTVFNFNYLSYQMLDDNETEDAADDQPTYASVRTTAIGDANWKRQLLHFSGSTFVSRPPADDTVVTWCRWHRKGSPRDYDPVLFYDGTVQLLPRVQDPTNLGYPCAGGSGCLTGSQRKPKQPS